MYTVYEIIDPVSFEVRYVGVTTISLEDRLKAHLYDKSNKYKYYWLQSILKKKYHPIIKEVFSNISKEKACEEEIKLIARYRSEGKRLTNILIGGELPPNHKGRKRSEETKRRMSLSLKGKKRTAEQNYRNSLSHKGLPSVNKGKSKDTDLSIMRGAIKRTGKKRTEEQNQKNSERQKGKKVSEEVKRKTSIKMREIRKNESPEKKVERIKKQKLSRLKNKPRVINIETKEVFLNAHEAGDRLNLTYLQVLNYIGRYKAKPDRPTKFKLQYLK